MRPERSSWAQFMARASVLSLMISVGVFVGVRLASAGPGEPVRKGLTVSGVLAGMSGGTATATFRFYRAMGDTTSLCAPEVPIRDGMERDPATGAFSVEVPLDQSGHVCPETLFHDPSAYVEVAIGGVTIVNRKPINPVPYAVYAQQYGTPDCPVGYERNPATPAGRSWCRRALAGGLYDEVVRVGVGPTAFWIDRYEASSNLARDASGAWLFESDTEPPGFPHNGQGATPPYVFSVARPAGTQPARWITWFQALEACAANGKALPTGSQWLRAARGTPDPGGCQVSSSDVRNAGGGAECQSVWGAQDMIGNLPEWTDEWHAGVGRTGFATSPGAVLRSSDSPSGEATFGAPMWTGMAAAAGWPDTFAGDQTANVNSAALSEGDSGGARFGVPSAAIRGGVVNAGSRAGVFAFDLTTSPSAWSRLIGFRCVIPR